MVGDLKAAINGLGAVATAVTLLVVVVEKFLAGAWLTVIVIPALDRWASYRYAGTSSTVARQLSLRGLSPSLRPAPTPRIVLPISGIHRGIVDAIAFAQSISPGCDGRSM